MKHVILPFFIIFYSLLFNLLLIMSNCILTILEKYYKIISGDDKIMTKKDGKKIVELLRKAYPEAKCSLDYTTPFEIVVAVMLSAQCTDERVNKTTPILFNRCKTLEDYINIDISELEKIIYPCGFYKNKAKNIKLCAKQIFENFNGIVPNNMDDLLTLAGVR